MEPNQLDQCLQVLERIAQGFAADSVESKSLALAAEALLFTASMNAREAFVKFLCDHNRVLSPAQIAHLRAIGIDVDAEC